MDHFLWDPKTHLLQLLGCYCLYAFLVTMVFLGGIRNFQSLSLCPRDVLSGKFPRSTALLKWHLRKKTLKQCTFEFLLLIWKFWPSPERMSVSDLASELTLVLSFSSLYLSGLEGKLCRRTFSDTMFEFPCLQFTEKFFYLQIGWDCFWYTN